MFFDPKLWRLTVEYRGRVLLSAFLGLLALAAGIARFAFLGRFLAGVFQQQLTFMPLIAAAAAILLRMILDHERTMIAHRTATMVQETLRGRLFDKIIALGPAWFGAERTGGVMLSMVDGVEQLQSFFGQYLPQVTIAACAPIAIFIFIAFWDVPVALVMLAAALFTLFLPSLVHERTGEASRARQSAFKSFGAEFLDAVQGLPTLKAFGQSAAYGCVLADKARALSDGTFWVLALNVMTRGFTDLGTALGSAAALALGAWRVRHGDMSLEALLIVLMAGTEIFRPLRDLRAVLHQGLHGQAAAAGINALLDVPIPHETGASVAGLKPEIEFDSVTFAYPGGRRPAHTGLSFRIAAGERVGIVGPSGSGKSTIIRLLARLHQPQSGVIRIGGLDLRRLDPVRVRRMIAVVAQDAYLFHGTVAENLRLGRPDATQAQLVEAARAANAHGFIASLPQGYDTVIGERGTQLSGGQRQRLAIARALLRDAPILILDEALSSVDTENEAIIQQALDRLMVGRTTLILAHRLSSVIGADRILVLKDGQVAQAGIHRDLIAEPGPYRDLMAPQLTEAASAAPNAVIEDVPTSDATATGTVITGLSEEAANITWPQTIRTLLRFVQPYRGQMGITLATGIGRVAAFIGVSVLGALILAAVRHGDATGLLVTALLICAPMAGLLHWLESWIAHAMAYALLAEMRIDLYRKLDALAPAYLLRRRSGDLVALATQDVETVEYFFAHTITPAIVAVLVPAAVIISLAWFAWPLAIALAPFLTYAGLSPVLGRRRIDAMGSAARSALGAIGAYATETIQGLSELVMFDAAAHRRAAFMTAVRDYQALRLKLLADLSFQAGALEVATGLGGLAVAAVGALLIPSGGLEATRLPLMVLISVAAFLPVSEIAQVGRQLADTIASTRRLHVVHSEQVTISDGPLEPRAVVGGSSVAFKHVDFTYPGRLVPALRTVSFSIPAGATVALVGPSGAGKSTLANLILRFWDPTNGTIRLDGIDLRELTLDGLRGRIALVAQDTYLFNNTLEANVRLARPDATPVEIRQALDRAALTDFVAGLPEGLGTLVGERGVALSGGQRQRIAIARAFLKDAPLLILDEATSHLDTVNEAAIRRALDDLMVDRTTIIVAHRLSTIRTADMILVMQAGSLVESGTHEALLARRGLYARLVEHQMASVAA
ncbi:MAG TPA: ABC transporter ATP-binding protein [Rhodopila sp.]|uniref:ABC transporter ATP-binding protein/permease n=1 Tax=Rhodopila sp. TaxID=2480087 RepID=UPI002CAA8AFE|nr:ABC transporter ATP-binding protein [Rhodopila sp.]HVY18173.1 ABC transporter ATP-binding protein [Rhodopila sp.]